MKELKLGLVLSGGGAKGAFQLGVWKAMEEIGFSKMVKAVSGSSVGALNGFMFTYCDYESAENLWLNHVDASKFFRSKGQRQQSLPYDNSSSHFMGWMPLSGGLDEKSMGLARSFMGSLYRKDNSMGLFSNTGIDELITFASHYIDYDKDCYPSLHVCAYEFMEKRPRYFKIDAFTNLMEAKSALLASSAIPLAFPPIKINGMHYYDGGCIDNIPVRQIADQDLDLIIVINIEGATTPYDYMCMYPYTNVLEIKPFACLGGMLSAMKFDPSFIHYCFTHGYEQGCNVFRDLFSCLNSGLDINVARSQVQSSVNDNLDPYPEEGISLERLSANLKDFFILTGEGINLAVPTMGGNMFWEDIDQHYGYRLQKNGFSQHYRILDSDDTRISWGSEIVQTYKFWQLSRGRDIEAPDITDIIKSIDLTDQPDVIDLDISFINSLEMDT